MNHVTSVFKPGPSTKDSISKIKDPSSGLLHAPENFKCIRDPRNGRILHFERVTECYGIKHTSFKGLGSLSTEPRRKLHVFWSFLLAKLELMLLSCIQHDLRRG